MPDSVLHGGGRERVRWYGSGLLALPIVLFVLFLDQLSKFSISLLLSQGAYYPFTSWFNFLLVHNSGAAFGFLSDAGGWQRWLFSILATAISLFILWLLRQRSWYRNRLYCLSLCFILAGAVGNLTDRLIFGYVVDFLDFHVFGWHWPTFNIADAAISCGAGLFLLDTLIHPQQKTKERVTSFE